MRWNWIPNAITLVRMALAAPLAWLILDQQHAAALALAMIAGASDAVDGLLAKRLSWQSQLGGLLDPMADKLMLLAAFVALAVTGVLPVWFVVLAVGRDAVIVAGAVAYHNLIGPLTAQPTYLSKITTVLQIVLVVAALLHDLDGFDLPGWLLPGLVWTTAAATAASGLDYVVSWAIRARREWRRAHGRTPS
jgi:cardiolipin synthase